MPLRKELEVSFHIVYFNLVKSVINVEILNRRFLLFNNDIILIQINWNATEGLNNANQYSKNEGLRRVHSGLQGV